MWTQLIAKNEKTEYRHMCGLNLLGGGGGGGGGGGPFINSKPYIFRVSILSLKQPNRSSSYRVICLSNN